MEANRNPKCTQNRGFPRKVPKVVWTYYLLYILTIGTLRKPHFLTPRSKQNAGLCRVVLRVPPRSCKMALRGPKNGESGVLPKVNLIKLAKVNQVPGPLLSPRAHCALALLTYLLTLAGGARWPRARFGFKWKEGFGLSSLIITPRYISNQYIFDLG